MIRVWERRYGLIQPTRGANRYRNYSDDDVVLLRYLKQEVDRGSSIGELAVAGRDALLARARAASPPPTRLSEQTPFTRLLDELCTALEPLDKTGFERRLNGAVAIVPFEEALHGILIPLQKRVGEMWHEGRISIAVEHYVSNLVQQKLFSIINQFPVTDRGPKVIVGCPANEHHELGALAVAYHCAVRGCRVIYVGRNTPVRDLAALCREIEPALVLLSVTFATNGNDLTTLVDSLVQHITPLCIVGLGGPGISSLREIGNRRLMLLQDFEALDHMLNRFLPAQSAVG